MITRKSWKALVVVHKEALTALSGKAKTLQQQAKHLSASHRVAVMFEGSAKAGRLCKGEALGQSVLWTQLCSPPNSYVKALISNVTVFGDRNFRG